MLGFNPLAPNPLSPPLPKGDSREFELRDTHKPPAATCPCTLLGLRIWSLGPPHRRLRQLLSVGLDAVPVDHISIWFEAGMVEDARVDFGRRLPDFLWPTSGRACPHI